MGSLSFVMYFSKFIIHQSVLYVILFFKKLVKWCKGKTRIKIREDTELYKFPLFCPKCKREQIINVQQLKVTVITELDA